MRSKRRIEVLGILIIFFFTAYVAFIASSAQKSVKSNDSPSTTHSKVAKPSDSISIEAAKKLYRKASIKQLRAQRSIIKNSDGF